MGFTLQPAKGDTFVNREALIDQMITELTDINSTVGYALYGKRRIGKTSILKEVQRRIDISEEAVVVYFSIWNLVEFTAEEFCKRLTMEIIDAYRPYTGLKYRASELIQTPISLVRKFLEGSEFKFIYNEFEFLITRQRDVDIDVALERAFSISEKLAEATGKKCILLIDEFPSIMELKHNNSMIGEGVLRKIRTIFEDWERTSLCVSGSIRSTMNLAILSSSSPFYRQLILREIKPLKMEHVRELLLKNLKISEKGIEEVCNFSAGIPFYIQYIGKILERSGRITLESIKEIENDFLNEEGDLLFREEFNALSPKDKMILINIAQGLHKPKELEAELRDRVSNVSKYLTSLSDKGYVSKKEKGYYVLEDPVFEKWILLHY